MKIMRLSIPILNIGLLLIVCQSINAQYLPRFSEGLYRVPYEDAQQINVGSDVWTHSPLGKYDMWSSSADKLIVAAANGWIRGIQESFNVACWSQDSAGNVTCCWDKNNYVIIEHPNGEFSGYTHVKFNSVSQQGISLNQWVSVGTPIGVEGNVGCSTGRHLHFEVSRPLDPNNAFQPVGGFLNNELLIPVICGIGINQSWFVAGGVYSSSPCSDNCDETANFSQSLFIEDETVIRANQLIQNTNNLDVTYAFGSVAQFRSGVEIILRPGFTVSEGAKFEALIKSCNEQE